LHPNDLPIIAALARKEVERFAKTADRAALQAFSPTFEIRDRNLFMMHGGIIADLGPVVAEKGDIGPRGVNGMNGRDGVDGKDGIDGKDGRDGKDGTDGKDGQDGQDGEDGVGVATAYVSAAGYLIIELSNGRKITAGYVKGKDGKDGKGGDILFGGASGQSGGSSDWADITGTPTTLAGYGITDAEPLRRSARGSALIDFGTALSGDSTAIATIAGQANIQSGDSVKVWVQGASDDHSEYEHAMILAGRVAVMASTVSAGSGFDIYASTELRLRGKVACRWEWSE